jgi:hypothetical protein
LTIGVVIGMMGNCFWGIESALWEMTILACIVLVECNWWMNFIVILGMEGI